MDKNTYRKKLATAPEKIQQLISAKTTTDTIRELNKKYSIKKPSPLAYEIGLILVGETHPKDFKKRLATELKLDDKQSLSLARDINRELFAGIKDTLMQIHGITQPSGSKNVQAKLTSPKPNVVSPFEKNATARSTTAPMEKKLPPAPVPPPEYLEKHGLAKPPMQNPKRESPKNSFEAQLVKKLKEKDTSPESSETSNTESELTANTSSDTSPKKATLHTTVAQTPQEITPVHTRDDSEKAASLDPYREPIE